jgi:hypothetical protein
MEDEMNDLVDVLHVLIARVRWFTEAARDKAHLIVEATREAPAPKPKTAKPPRTVPPTDA